MPAREYEQPWPQPNFTGGPLCAATFVQSVRISRCVCVCACACACPCLFPCPCPVARCPPPSLPPLALQEKRPRSAYPGADRTGFGLWLARVRRWGVAIACAAASQRTLPPHTCKHTRTLPPCKPWLTRADDPEGSDAGSKGSGSAKELGEMRRRSAASTTLAKHKSPLTMPAGQAQGLGTREQHVEVQNGGANRHGKQLCYLGVSIPPTVRFDALVRLAHSWQSPSSTEKRWRINWSAGSDLRDHSSLAAQSCFGYLCPLQSEKPVGIVVMKRMSNRR